MKARRDDPPRLSAVSFLYSVPEPAEPPAVEHAGAAYRFIYTADSVDRIGLVRKGLEARTLSTLAEEMQVPRERLYGWLGLPRTTANRKLKREERLSPDESERVLGLVRLVGQVQQIVAESGRPEGFDAARWTAEWLQQPNAALGGRPPAEFMDTGDGRALVEGLVAQMQSGAYA